MSKSKQTVVSAGVAMAAGGFTSTQLTMSAFPKAAIVGAVAAGVFVIVSLLLRPRSTT
jgi:hypothetical protein